MTMKRVMRFLQFAVQRMNHGSCQGQHLGMTRGHQPILLEVKGVAYNEAYPMQDFFVVLKVYSIEFDCFVLEEVLKILALNVGMAYVVDQANVMYANLDHGGLIPLFVL